MTLFTLNETENYMTGYRVVFDREKLVLAWKKFDCKFPLTCVIYH